MKTGDMMTVFITRNALLRGIVSKEVMYEKRNKVAVDLKTGARYYYNLNEWHKTFKDAIKQARKTRDAEITRLKRLSFNTVVSEA